MKPESEFKETCRQYLNSARPIQNVEHLKGRQHAHQRLVDALNLPGKHAFIYGNRGVGKTSLAQTSARTVQPTLPQQLLVACDHSSTFKSICRDIIKRLLAFNPLLVGVHRKVSGGANFLGYGVNLSWDKSQAKLDVEIKTVNDVLNYIRFANETIGHESIVIVDEFDVLTNTVEHKKFAILLKQLSEQSINVKLVFCGISDLIDVLFAAHESVHRCIHAEKLDRLSMAARIEIIADAAEALNMPVPSHMQYRIAQASDGFPYYIHLICEKMFISAYRKNSELITHDVFSESLDEAIASIEPHLKTPYEDSIRKNSNNLEHILWAIANDDLLEVQLTTIWKHYKKICSDLRIQEQNKQNLTTKLNNLSKPPYGSILSKPRRSYYTFTEKMMRGYARLVAMKAGVELGPENPGA